MPAYNESNCIYQVLSDFVPFVQKNNFKLIIVNDASTDTTKQIAEKFVDGSYIKLINHKVNRGYGGAIKSGIKICDTDYVITVDSDGQHQVSDVLNLYNQILIKDADMIVGQRIGDLHSTKIRSLGKFLIKLFIRLIVKVPVKDINSGMKIYKTTLAKRAIMLSPSGMAFSDVMTISFYHLGYYLIEIPITVKSRISGESTITYKTAFETIREILFIAIVFSPYRFFSLMSMVTLSISFGWGLKFVLEGKGVTTGTSIGILLAVILWSLGVITQLIASIRKDLLEVIEN
jgi:glycosyltransferase involved in cell wall biosynthesis